MARLPNLAAPLTEEALDPAFFANVVPPQRYVWPDLLIESEADARVLLVTAPGAMGKSVTAAATAALLNAPLIDLAKLPIGSDSLTGLLTRVLGWRQAPEFVTSLQNGQASLVLDSLDEAHLAAGRQHFLAFMRNIVDLLSGGAARSQVVIFGRRDTIETAELALSELGEAVSVTSVTALSYSQSCQLIDVVLDDLVVDGRRYTTHRTHSNPFGQHRDNMLFGMAKALGSSRENIESCWKDVGDFLGYPPVLLVMSRHLAVDNPAALVASHVHGTSSTRGGLLLEVVEEILDRESEKVRAQMGQALGIGKGDDLRNVIYTREEQVLRLEAFVRAEPLGIAVPTALSAEQSAVYQELIEGFVPDHPFLRGRDIENVVFEDYVKAYAVTSPTIEVHDIFGGPISASAVGPFFAHFLHAMAEKGQDGPHRGAARIPERVLDATIKSFMAGAARPDAFVYSDRLEGEGRLFVGDLGENGGFPVYLQFAVVERSGVIELSSPVGRGLLASGGGLSINSSTDEIILGPDLALFVADLELEAKRLTVVSGTTYQNSPNGGVIIIASGDVTHPHDLRISAHPGNALAVVFKNAWHMWRPYVLKIGRPESRLSSGTSWQVMFGIRRLLTIFHSSAADDPSLFGERLERFGVGNNPAFEAALQALLELEVIRREGNLYRLRLTRLTDYGVNWAAMRGPDFSETLSRLHAEVCKTSHVQALADGGL
jgi:hypothetical protein